MSLRITNVFYNCSDLTRSICQSRVTINGEVEWMKGYIYIYIVEVALYLNQQQQKRKKITCGKTE